MSMLYIMIGLVAGLSLNRYRQTRIDLQVFKLGLSRGIHLSKLAHTELLLCRDSDTLKTRLYIPVAFTLPYKNEIK